MEKALVKSAAKAAGFTKSDAKEALFIPRKHVGHGIRSITIIHLVNLAREAEVFLNGHGLASRTVRVRLESAALGGQTLGNITGNFIAESIAVLASFGIYLNRKSVV